MDYDQGKRQLETNRDILSKGDHDGAWCSSTAARVSFPLFLFFFLGLSEISQHFRRHQPLQKPSDSSCIGITVFEYRRQTCAVIGCTTVATALTCCCCWCTKPALSANANRCQPTSRHPCRCSHMLVCALHGRLGAAWLQLDLVYDASSIRLHIPPVGTDSSRPPGSLEAYEENGMNG